MKTDRHDKEPRGPSIWEPVVALVVLAGLLAVLLCKNAGHLCRIFCAVLLAVLLGGCASTVPGRFTGVEWESRSPEQLTAAVPSDTAVYGNSASAKAEARPFTQWQALFDMISGLRVRIRICTAEWGSDTRPLTVEAKPK